MNGRSRGFTLVEMLVAISVAALLVSLVYGAVRVGQRSAQALDASIEHTEVMRIGWQYLHGALVRARPVSDPVDTDDRTGFAGDATSLTFVADMPAYVGLGGLIRIRLAARRGDDGDQLVLTRQRYDPTATASPDETLESAVLVERLEALEIAYFGQNEPGEPPAWHGSWNNPNTLPNLVSIAVHPREQRGWPLLIARPMTGSTPLPEESESFDTAAEVTD